jgi:hypothetical protein
MRQITCRMPGGVDKVDTPTHFKERSQAAKRSASLGFFDNKRKKYVAAAAALK